MSGLSIGLVLVSAVLHAAWNRYLHGSSDRVAVMAVSYLTGGVMLVPWIVADPPTEVAGWVVVSGAAHATYLTLLAMSYGLGGLSITYPIARGLSPLLVTLGALVWLDQRPDAGTGAGVVLVTFGILVLALVGKHTAQLPAVLMAVATGVAVTAYTLVDARAVQDVDPVGFLGVIGLIAGLTALAIARADLNRIRPVLRSGSLVASMQMGSYLLLLLALQQAQVAQVASLRQLSVFIGVVLAGEAFRRQTYIAGALVAVGAVLIAL